MWDKKRFLLLNLVILSIITTFQLNIARYYIIDNSLSIYKDQIPNSSQFGLNYSINIIKPELFIIEGRLGINVTSSISGEIHCALEEQSGERYFLKINQSINLIGNNKSQLIIIKAIPLITTFPGEYHFTLNITGLINYSESFNMFLGMGYSLFTIVLAFSLILVIMAVLSRRNNSKKGKLGGNNATQISLSSQTVEDGKIPCPKCNKMIDKGLFFCPECGERIPEFLRFKPK